MKPFAIFLTVTSCLALVVKTNLSRTSAPTPTQDKISTSNSSAVYAQNSIPVDAGNGLAEPISVSPNRGKITLPASSVPTVPGTTIPAPGAISENATIAPSAPAPSTPATSPASNPPTTNTTAPPAPGAVTPSGSRTVVEDKIIRPGTSLIIQSEIQNKNEEARASLQDYLQFRDPFKSPEMQATAQGNVSILEKYILTEYKLTGIMTGPLRMRAMILSPDGKTHFVSEGMKLGNRGGNIKKITTKSVVVRERSVNALGEEEFTTTQILMTPDSNTSGVLGGSPK